MSEDPKNNPLPDDSAGRQPKAPFPGAVLPPDTPYGQRPPDKVKRNYFLGVVVAFLVVGSFALGQHIESLKPAAASDRCETKVISAGETPPMTLEGVDFSDFWRVWQTVKSRHVSQPTSDLDLFYGALEGLVGSLDDPYSVFFDPEFAQKFNDELAGTFQGIGAEIGIKKNQLTVIAPLPGTPADQAGLQAKDIILAVDGEETFDMSLDQAVSKIRGPKGSTVVLTVARQGWSETKDISIVRDQIYVKSVKWKTVKEDNRTIGVISISHFNEDTESSFNQAVRSVLLENPDGVILDLRNNPGGFLDTAVKVAGEWVARKVVLRERFSEQEQAKEYVADGNARLDGLRTVVLVNGGSASASEIVAGALQDYGKAVVIGEQTYGKGSVQDYTEYEDGSALKLTVALWYTPNDRSIDKNGIEPDIYSVRTFEDFNSDKDPPMDKALTVLTAEKWPPDKEPKPDDVDGNGNGDSSGNGNSDSDSNDSGDSDSQQ